MIRVYSKFKDKETHEYDLVKIADQTLLKCSRNGEWSDHMKGKQVASLEDDGNGVKINIEGKKIKLDYLQAFQILVLLAKNNDLPFKICEEKTIVNYEAVTR